MNCGRYKISSEPTVNRVWLILYSYVWLILYSYVWHAHHVLDTNNPAQRHTKTNNRYLFQFHRRRQQSIWSNFPHKLLHSSISSMCHVIPSGPGMLFIDIYTGHTQKNGAVLIVFTIKTAPFFCVCPVYLYRAYTKEWCGFTPFHFLTWIRL